MVKRILALALWFLVGWTLGGFLAFAVGIPEATGPLLGVGAVAVVSAVGRQTANRRPAGQA